MLETLLLPLGLSFLCAAVITPLVIWIFRKKGWVDDPKKNPQPKMTHDHPIPRGGGLVIFLAVAIVSVILLPLDKHVLGILLGALVLAVLGFWDDLRDLSPYLRLPLLILPALCVVGAGIGIAFVSNPLGPGVIPLDTWQLPIWLLGKTRSIWVWADLLAIIWIFWTMNIVNWSKGLDGQMPGFVGIAAIFIGLLSLRFADDPAQWKVIILAMIVAGAFFGFLVWNHFPQKILAGYGAGSLAGYFLAVLAILSGAKLATAVLVLAIPTIDATAVIVRRLVQHKSPFWGDRGHLHHRLLDLGWGKRRVAAFYWISTFILGCAALGLNSEQKFYTIVGLFVLVGGFIAWLTLFISSSKQPVRGNG